VVLRIGERTQRTIRRLSGFALLCFLASPLLASNGHVEARGEEAALAGRVPTGQIVFADERLLADLVARFDRAGLENRPALNGDDWWKQLTPS